MTRKIQYEFVGGLYHLKDGSQSEPGSVMLIGAPQDAFSKYIMSAVRKNESLELVYTEGLGQSLQEEESARASKKK